MNYSKIVLPVGLAIALLTSCGGGKDSTSPPQTNMAPKGTASSFTTQADTAYTGRVTATDADSNDITYAVSTAPAHGKLTLNADGNFSYTPDAEFVGSDIFSFTASDSTQRSAATEVKITVDLQQVSFNDYSRKAFNQMASDKPLPLNSRKVTQDVTAANAYDDLLMH